MRHTDLRMPMKVYTDPKIFNPSAAVEKLPGLSCSESKRREPPARRVKLGGVKAVLAQRLGQGFVRHAMARMTDRPNVQKALQNKGKTHDWRALARKV